MNFDPENNIVKLCGQGMLLEGEGKPHEAAALFNQAWEEATNNFEKFIAAHYIARHQDSVTDKLNWDKIALDLALNVTEGGIRDAYPSLYLNVGKCYEDLGNFPNANENYQLALHFAAFLPDDGYSNMIRAGINSGIERVN